MREEVIFSELKEIINEKDRISQDYSPEKWKAFEYSTGKCSGHMLVTPEDCYPEEISFDMNLKGIYNIYLCLPKLRSDNYIDIKLSGDLCYTGISASNHTPANWTTEEFLEEVYWKTADLTNEKIIFKKPKSSWLFTTGIAWVRCTPADSVPAMPENRCMQMHIDGDLPAMEINSSYEEYLMKLCPMKDSNVDFVSFEFSFEIDSFDKANRGHLLHMDKKWDEGNYNYIPKKDEIYKKAVEYAKKNNISIYAANRMQVSNFITPFTRYGWNMKFVDDNPQYHLKTRTGTTVNLCSYAYPEVQDFVTEKFVDMVKLGFDGISLIYHRGIHIGFDKPVIDRFKKLYPDIDPHCLPASDPRLHGVWCEFMNEFMSKLRKAVGNVKINVITDFSLETSKNFGSDVEYWAKNGLVDSVSQAGMETFEVLDGCMDDNHHGFIDLEKYKKALAERTVVKRHYGTDMEKVCKHIPEFNRLKALYGIEVYSTLPWVKSLMPEEYPEAIETLKRAGAEKFLSWNTNHLMTDLPEWYAVSRAGNDALDIPLRNFYRVLSFDGYDISQFHPNWRG